MVHYLDKLVGRVVKKLDDEGVRDNTLLLFTCDNGCATNIKSLMKGRVIKGGKASLPDAGTHVSLVANWPSAVKPGQVVDALVDFTDFLPSLAEVAGAGVPANTGGDGHSFVSVLKGTSASARKWIFCHYIRNGVKPRPSSAGKVAAEIAKQEAAKKKKTMGRFARNQRYKLYGDGRLYDVQQDVLENKALVADKDSVELREIRSMLQGVHDGMPQWRAFQQKKKETR
jgi:arylsulfatase A